MLGILLFAIFGFNGNFEIKGYNEFSVSVPVEQAKSYADYQKTIAPIVNGNGGEFETISIFAEGDNTKIVVRYLNQISNQEKSHITTQVASKLGVELTDISAHNFVQPSVKNKDYIITAGIILLLVAVSTLFAYIRYNGASALAVVAS